MSDQPMSDEEPDDHEQQALLGAPGPVPGAALRSYAAAGGGLLRSQAAVLALFWARLGLGRIVALHHRSATSYHIF
jgi:hypothetical protein